MLHSLALSTLDWWEEAGVDTIVGEEARDWLAPAVSAPTRLVTAPAIAASAIATPTAMAPASALPADLAAFRAFLLADASLPGPPAARLDASGDAAGGTMMVLDMPEAEDRATRTLLSGEAGALFDRMLGAMKLTRDAVYLAPLSPARPASGRIDAAAAMRLADLMRHHIALARPKRLLLLGDATVRALIGLPCAEARGRTHELMIGGDTVPAIASFHPRFLVQTPARKAAAWADLQLFMAL